MKPDVQKALLATAGRYIRKLFGEVEPRIKALEEQTAMVTKLLGRIDLLEKALADRPLPEKGDRGEKGEPGADAEPVLVADVVAELLSTKMLDPILDLLATDAVSKHFEANPVLHGRDGNDGEPGPQGDKGVSGTDGQNGRDGLDVKDLFRAEGGKLLAVMSDGTTKDLGVFVGADGKDGRDGLSVADVTRAYDPEAHEVVERWTADGEQKELRYPAGGIRPGGYWREGMKSLAAQAVTHGGALWIAKRDTAAKPCIENAEDWQLAARQGRDGRDGKDGKLPPGPVSLKADGDD
jgi:hypothetical protein